MERLDALTGMRGVAALLVVGFHAVRVVWLAQLETGVSPADAFEHPLSSRFLGAGWVGVDFFFVLSGFLLAWPLLRQARPLPGAAAYRLYAAKRLLRIAPPYYASFLVVYAFVGWVEPPHPLYRFTAEGLLLHLAYLHTFVQEHLFSINGVAWTLGIELQFYLLLPLMVLPFRRLGPAAALPYAAVAVAYLAWTATVADAQQGRFLAFQMPAFLGHFGFGIAAAQLLQRGWRSPVHADAAAVASLLALIAAPAALLGYPSQFEPKGGLGYVLAVRPLAGLAFALLLLFALQPRSRVGGALASRPLRWLGELSYSLYLTHLAVAGWFLIFRREWVVEAGVPGFTAVLTAASLVVALAFWLAVERPSLWLKDRVAARMQGRAGPA